MRESRFMVKHLVKALLLFIIAVAVIGALFFYRQTPKPPEMMLLAEPSPSPEIVLTGQSADGKISMAMNQKIKADKATWTLSVSNAQETAKIIWSETLPLDTTVSIPFNAVSPDNKYLFLKQKGPDKTRYLVLTTTGAAMANGSQTLEFSGQFNSNFPDYKIIEVTGWGGINLIVFNTDKISGGIGPSFWFDLSGQSFILLSNRFN